MVRAALTLQNERRSHDASLSREDQRIALEAKRLRDTTDASQIEIEVNAVRLAREHGAQFAGLISTFFDKLTSPNSAHRELALMAISGFIETDELKAILDKMFDPPKDLSAKGVIATSSAGTPPER